MQVEEALPLKADREEMLAAIKEIRDELEAMNLKEIIAMAQAVSHAVFHRNVLVLVV